MFPMMKILSGQGAALELFPQFLIGHLRLTITSTAAE
jgi:hypothetical protein